MRAGVGISSWLGLAGRVGQTRRGPWGAASPLQLSRRLELVGQSYELPSDRPLQVWGMLFPHLKGVLPMAYQSL